MGGFETARTRQQPEESCENPCDDSGAIDLGISSKVPWSLSWRTRWLRSRARADGMLQRLAFGKGRRGEALRIEGG